MIGIFKTNIIDPHDGEKIFTAIKNQLKVGRCNIDYEDIDKVLRIEELDSNGHEIIIMVVRSLGFQCALLED